MRLRRAGREELEMRRFLTVTAVFALVCMCGMARADEVIIPRGGDIVNISNGGVFRVWAHDNSTTNVSGGTFEDIRTFEHSTANIYAGAGNTLESADYSTINVSGGVYQNASSWDSSILNITGGQMNTVMGRENATVNISGGSISYFECQQYPEYPQYTFGSITVNISGGSVGVAGIYGGNTLNITGGHIDAWLENYGIVNMSGGGCGHIVAAGDSRLVFYGSDFVVSDGVLNGIWHDGTPFSQLLSVRDNATVFVSSSTIWDATAQQVYIPGPSGGNGEVPEPMSVLLAAGGLVSLWGMRRRRA